MMSERKKPVSVRQLAFTPQWIAMLVLALIVAAVFAWLGKWQIERAIIQGAKDSYDTEVAVPLESITEPGKPMVLEAGGRRVTFDATLDRGSLIVVGNRSNEGVIGCWVTGR
ncbi:MAG: SURF1 family protein, partial [Actinobacteria bacterium]|nr:SURF1 family protein [Actinomycetota bacterium]